MMTFFRWGRHWFINTFLTALWSLGLSSRLQHLLSVSHPLFLYHHAPVWWLPSPERILWTRSSSLTHSSTKAPQWCKWGENPSFSVFAFAWIGFKASFFLSSWTEIHSSFSWVSFNPEYIMQRKQEWSNSHVRNVQRISAIPRLVQ